MSAQLVPDLPEVDAEVVVLAWPAREPERRLLAAAGQPRILVVAPEERPPTVADELEDWIREPVDLVELTMRSTTLRARHRARRDTARLEPGGILRHRGRWVAVSPAQEPLVRVLLAHLGRLVRTSELRRAHAGAGGVDDDLALAAVLRRLAPALATVGLDLHRLRERGWLLDCVTGPSRPTPAEPVPARRLRGVAGRQAITGRASVRAAWTRGRSGERSVSGEG